jgi:hypothetical protein
MYTPTKWEDHTSSLPGVFKVVPYDEANDLYKISEGGTIMVQGTPQDQTHFNNMETGILDVHLALATVFNYTRQTAWGLDDTTSEIEKWTAAYDAAQAGVNAKILDAQIAFPIMLNYVRQTVWRLDDDESQIESWIAAHNILEIGTISLTNTLSFPFNNSIKSVALTRRQNTTNYIVLTDIAAFTGNVGDVEVSDKLVNGFKIAYTGSASAATIQYTVIGGFNE